MHCTSWINFEANRSSNDSFSSSFQHVYLQNFNITVRTNEGYSRKKIRDSAFRDNTIFPHLFFFQILLEKFPGSFVSAG